MKRLFITLAAAALITIGGLTGPALAFQPEGCTTKGCKGECTKCHTLKKEEADKLLKTEKFGAEVTEVAPAPVSGLWRVVIKKGDKKFIVFVDFGKKYILENVRFTPVRDIGKPPELKKVDIKEIPLDRAIVIGDPGAEKKVIVFDDPECPYCRRLHGELKEIVKKRKDIAFYVKMFPLPSHPGAYEASRTIVCSGTLKALDEAFEGKKLGKAECDTREVDDNIALGKKLGIRGTPTLILPDGRLLPGYVPSQVLLNLVDNPA